MKYHKIISIKETFTHTLVLLLVAGNIFRCKLWYWNLSDKYTLSAGTYIFHSNFSFEFLLRVIQLDHSTTLIETQWRSMMARKNLHISICVSLSVQAWHITARMFLIWIYMYESRRVHEKYLTKLKTCGLVNKGVLSDFSDQYVVSHWNRNQE